jgi:hypothetical protein
MDGETPDIRMALEAVKKLLPKLTDYQLNWLKVHGIHSEQKRRAGLEPVGEPGQSAAVIVPGL